MNKKSLLLFSILPIIFSLFFISCDSLLRVQDTSIISMNINLSEITGNDMAALRALSSTAPALIDSDDGDDDFFDGDRLTVSLYYADSTTSFAQQELFIDEIDDVTDVRVQFGKIPVGREIFATIVIERFDDDTWIRVFESRSANVVTHTGGMELVTYANVVFLAHEKGAEENTSKGAGITADNPITSFNDAIAILKSTGSFFTGATIYLTQSIEVTNDDTELGQKASDGGRLVDLEGLTIKRQVADYPFFEIEDENSLTLERATLKGDENAKAPLIEVSGKNSTLILRNESILQDNVNRNYSDNDDDINQATAGVNVLDGAKLIMENSAIINNTAVIPFAVAGVNLGENAILELQGGNVFISGNVTDDMLGSNVHYALPMESDAIAKKTFPVQVTGALSDDSKIGLSPKTVGADTYEIVMSNGGTVKQSNFSMDDGSSVILTEDGHLSFVPPKYIFIGGSTSSDNNDGLTENTPVKTFAKAQELYNVGDTIEVVGTIEVSGTEIWKEEEGQQINLVFKYDDGTGNPITPDFTLVHVTSTGELTLDNVDINPAGSGLASDALVTVEGKLVLMGNVTIYGNFFVGDSSIEPDAVFKKGSVELKNAGTLELHDGHIRLGHGIRYTLPQDGQSSPISIEGTLMEDSSGNSSVVYFLINERPALGTVLVEKGTNGVINPDDFFVPAMSAWGDPTDSNDIQTGVELNQNGDLVYVERSDDVFISSTGNDTKYGTEAEPVKTFERALDLVKGWGTIWVMDTISINDTFEWDSIYVTTVKRHTNNTGSLISVDKGASLTFPQGANVTFDGNGTDNVVARASLITVLGEKDNEGFLTFAENHSVVLKNNTNNDGAGAILVDGGYVIIEDRTSTSQNQAATIENNTSGLDVSSGSSSGAITIQNDGVVELSGLVSENYGGSGIHVGEKGTLVLSGNAAVKNNAVAQGSQQQQNITYDIPSDEGYGIYIDGKLTSTEDAVIGITLPFNPGDGAPIVRKLVDSDYHPTAADFNKFSNDIGNAFCFDSVLGQVETYSVWYAVSANGDDNNNGTEDKPFASLQRAIDKIIENRVNIDDTYITWSITIEGEITLDSNSTDNAMAVIDSDGLKITLSGSGPNGETATLNASGQNQRVLHVGKNVDITLGGLTITGGCDIDDIDDDGNVDEKIVAGGVYLDAGSVLQFSSGSKVVIKDNYKKDGTTKSNVSYAYEDDDNSERGRIDVSDELGADSLIGITVPAVQEAGSVVVNETSGSGIDFTPWFFNDAGGSFARDNTGNLLK